MIIDIALAPGRKRAAGERCCEPELLPEVDATGAARIAAVAKALSDPIRVQLVDVLRAHAGEVCVCDLEPLFPISQPTLSHHLRKLREAGIVGVERRGLWAYYHVHPAAIEELGAWLAEPCCEPPASAGSCC
jgi:ArsR family transcriptional regulator